VSERWKDQSGQEHELCEVCGDCFLCGPCYCEAELDAELDAGLDAELDAEDEK
jgi:hypothetical protein